MNIFKEVSNQDDMTSGDIIKQFMDQGLSETVVDYNVLGRSRGSVYGSLRSYALRNKCPVTVTMRNGEIIMKKI